MWVSFVGLQDLRSPHESRRENARLDLRQVRSKTAEECDQEERALMFITGKTALERNGEQTAEGRFLILMRPEGSTMIAELPIRAIVRYVRMSRFGDVLMADISIAGHRLAICGSYGNDGLTCAVPTKTYLHGVPLPYELHEAWSNDCGSPHRRTRAAMRKWALATFKPNKPAAVADLGLRRKQTRNTKGR
jgi:hypothetical protein